jgi:outer membrane protein TolC
MSKVYFNRFLSFLIILLIIAVPVLHAQDISRPISLDEAIKAALNNNRSVKLAEIDEAIAGAGYKQTEAIHLPQVQVSYTGMSTNNPLNAFGFKLQQQSIAATDFNPALLNNPGATGNFSTELTVQQPLINMDLLYQRKSASKQVEIYQLKNQRTKEYIRFAVQKAYLELQFAYQAAAVLDEALQTGKAVYKLTNDHYLQGLIQKSDVLTVQVQVSTIETRLAAIKSQISNASDNLSVLMGVNKGTVYTTPPFQSTGDFNTDTLSAVPALRADFMAMQKAIEAGNLMIEANKKTYLPRLNAFGSYQLNDRKLFGFGAGAYLAGIRLSWDIFKGNSTKNSIAKQTLEQNRLAVQLSEQKEESNQELAKTRRALEDNRFAIKQYQTAIEQAAEAARILQNRYEQGLVTTTDVMIATTQVATQKLALAEALFGQQVNRTYLELLTGSISK